MLDNHPNVAWPYPCKVLHGYGEPVLSVAVDGHTIRRGDWVSGISSGWQVVDGEWGRLPDRRIEGHAWMLTPTMAALTGIDEFDLYVVPVGTMAPAVRGLLTAHA